MFDFLSKMSPQDGPCKKLRNCVYVVTVMQKKICGLFFRDTVYLGECSAQWLSDVESSTKI